MIYTVTLNPSLDYYLACGGFEMGRTNRADRTSILPGGKGINVSIMLSRMGTDSVALGFVGGFTGNEIVRKLKDYNVKSDFITLQEGESRINVKIEDVEGTEINAPGPMIDNTAVDMLWARLDRLEAGDILVLSGSVPKGMPQDIYEQIAGVCRQKNVKCVVDAEGDLLMQTLKYEPYLVKPNNHELAALYGVAINDYDDAIKYGRKLKESGARNVLVSMAGDGAVFIGEDDSVFINGSVEGEFINGVGAGDSMVAGFLAGFAKSGEYRTAFLQAVSAASATAFSEGLGEEKLINDILEKLLTI